MRAPNRAMATLVVLALLSAPTSALAQTGSGPCDLHQGEDESVRSFSKRLIRCAADRWEVPGGWEKAVCIADAESGLDPEATSEHRRYLGLFQHSADAWPERYRIWTRQAWGLDESALSGRTNAVVTMRMVNTNGWGPWQGAGDC